MTSEANAFQTGQHPSSDSSETDIQLADKLAWLDAIENSEQKHESSSGFREKAQIDRQSPSMRLLMSVIILYTPCLPLRPQNFECLGG